MTTDDPLTVSRLALDRLRTALNDCSHWVFLTDDASAACALRNAAGADALFLEAVMCFSDRREVFPIAILAVSKKAWPPSPALRVAAAATSRHGACPDGKRVRGGADIFAISQNPERLAIVMQQIRNGALSLNPPGDR